MSFQEKPKAQWQLIKSQNDLSVFVSTGGGAKVVQQGTDGQESIIAMMPAKGLVRLVQAFGLITDCVPVLEAAIEESKANKQAERDRLYIQRKAQVQAERAMQSLKALNLTPEQIAAFLTKAS